MQHLLKVFGLTTMLMLAACSQPQRTPSDPGKIIESTPEASIVQPSFAQDSIVDKAVAQFEQARANNPSLPLEPEPTQSGKAPVGLGDGRLVGKDLIVEQTQPGVDPFLVRDGPITNTTLPAPPQGPFLEDDILEEEPLSLQGETTALRKLSPILKLAQRVKLFMHFKNPSTSSQCSGTLVDSEWVLTAAHCVYRFEGENDPNNGYATLVEVVPGFSGNSEPFGRAFGSQILIFTPYRDHGDFQHDVAYVRLTRPIGGAVGYHSVLNTTCDFLTNSANEFQTSGYPAESKFNSLFTGNNMFHRAFRFDSCKDFTASLNAASFGGMSGSGAVLVSGSAHAVLSTSDRESSSTYAILNLGKVNRLKNEINATTPSSLDLVPLMVNARREPPKIRIPQSLSASDVSVQRSRNGSVSCFTQGAEAQVSFRVHNPTSATFGSTLRYTVYLSSDDSISSSDTALGSFNFSETIGARQTRAVSAKVKLPSFTPTGRRFIGIIITNTDANTSNNDSSGDDAGEMDIKFSC